MLLKSVLLKHLALLSEQIIIVLKTFSICPIHNWKKISNFKVKMEFGSFASFYKFLQVFTVLIALSM